MYAARARKLTDRISQIVAEMLERRIKDPRLGFVTVTEARLTNDLRAASGELAAFYIFPPGAKRSISNLFSTHPPLEARIAALQRLEAQLQGTA